MIVQALVAAGPFRVVSSVVIEDPEDLEEAKRRVETQTRCHLIALGVRNA